MYRKITKTTASTLIISSGITFAHTGSDESRFIDEATPKLAGHTVVFSDEFNAEKFDYTKWKVGINAGNAIREAQESPYLAKGISLQDGLLHLTASKEDTPVEARVYGGKDKLFNYSSGAINTDGLFHVKDDFYVEIRCKFPDNDGGFCAFWAQPTRGKAGKNMKLEDLIEIDMFEFKASLKKSDHYRYFSTLWWHYLTKEEAAQFPESRIQKKSDGSFTIKHQSYKPHFQPKEGRVTERIDFSKFVTVGFRASKDKLTWHIVQDGSASNAPAYLTFKGAEVETRKLKENNNVPLKVHRPVPKINNYLILNYRVSNQAWLGGPIDEAKLPANLLVDYIRVYQPQATPNPQP